MVKFGRGGTGDSEGAEGRVETLTFGCDDLNESVHRCGTKGAYRSTLRQHGRKVPTANRWCSWGDIRVVGPCVLTRLGIISARRERRGGSRTIGGG